MGTSPRHLFALVVCFIVKTWGNTAGEVIELGEITYELRLWYSFFFSDRRSTNVFYEGPDSIFGFVEHTVFV